MSRSPTVRRLAWTAAGIALVVVVLGAWVRLSHAGLGCPDWPVCYGKITWPVGPDEIAAANAAFPERPVETPKAWREQIHRFAAALLGLLVLSLALLCNWHRPARRLVVSAAAAAAATGTLSYVLGATALSVGASVVALLLPLYGIVFWRGDASGRLSLGLLGLVVFQAMLGMWTVTLLLKPAVVTAHLLGGLATLALLSWLAAMHTWDSSRLSAGLRRLAVVALAAVIAQVFLGGWTSTNYAALACPDFPTCQGRWLPEMDLGEAFVLWRGIGVDYEGGILDASARAAIHYVHRLGALAVSLVVGWLVLRLWGVPRYRIHAAVIGLALLAQLTLGIWNVVGGLPLWVAVGHNGVAALLVVSLVLLACRSRRGLAT